MGRRGIDPNPKRVHLYPFDQVLRPRGSMEKESIGKYILDQLRSTYQSWTASSFGDNPPKESLLFALEENLKAECQDAWEKFLSEVSDD